MADSCGSSSKSCNLVLQLNCDYLCVDASLLKGGVDPFYDNGQMVLF